MVSIRGRFTVFHGIFWLIVWSATLGIFFTRLVRHVLWHRASGTVITNQQEILTGSNGRHYMQYHSQISFSVGTRKRADDVDSSSSLSSSSTATTTKTYMIVTNTRHNKYREGTLVDVMYNPTNPNRAKIAKENATEMGIAGVINFIISACTFFIYRVRLSSKKNQSSSTSASSSSTSFYHRKNGTQMMGEQDISSDYGIMM